MDIKISSKKAGDILLIETPNIGNASIKIPGNIKPGIYELSVINKDGSSITSSEFIVKRKIPLALKLSPLVIIPIIILVSQDDGTGSSIASPPSQPIGGN